MSKGNLKREILDWLKKERKTGRKFFSIPIQKFVEFTPRGFKHAISRNYKYQDVEIQLIKKIPEVLPNSHYIGFEKNTLKQNKDIIGVHNYYDIILYDGELYEVWFKVKQTKSKTYFYDYGIIRKLK